MDLRLRRSLLHPVLALLGIPLGADALAAQDSTRADSASRLRQVRVTESRSVGVVGGASAIVIRPEQLRSSPAPLLDQALRETPFVLVRQNSRGEMEVSVRGSDSRQAAVLLDGVPITLGWDHRTDPSLIPITGSQRLVIIRGLGSLLTGPNTLGGTIEVTHDARADAPGTGRAWAGVGLDEFGSYVLTFGGGRNVAVGGGAFSFRGGVARRDRDGVALPDGAVDPTSAGGLRTNTDLQETDGFASLRWSAANGGGIGLNVAAFDAERGVPPEEHLTTPRLWRYPYHTRGIGTLSASTGAFTTALGTGSFEVGVGLNSGRLKIETFNNRDYQTVTGEEFGNEKTWTGRALLSHSLVGGSTLRASFTNADVRYTETLSPAAGVDYRQKLWSAGGEIETPLGSRTSVVGGVVFDKSTTPETGGRTPAQQPFDNVGWRAGITHDVSGAVRLHANASERSRFPALRELYSGALNRFRPNPDLKPERLLGLEGGVTVNRSLGGIPEATFQVTGFRHRLEDAVIRITLSNPTRFMRVNRDRIESTGAEFLAGFVFGDDRERSVLLNGDLTLQSIKVFDQTANDLQRHAENNPETRGTVELGLPLPAKIRAYGTARYTGTQYCLNADTSREMELGGQTRSDVGIERTFALASQGLFRAVRALVAFDNLSNATVYDQCGLPQPGRTLRVMFTLR
ncbi:MAG: TonB-dependent receptor [Cytophagaceae bacterium]|nr:TonB-dependent receptor [Gemmatimonadaceae bacterium]